MSWDEFLFLNRYKQYFSEFIFSALFDIVMNFKIELKFCTCFSIVAWILIKIFPSLLQAILVHKGQMDVVKKASEVRLADKYW